MRTTRAFEYRLDWIVSFVAVAEHHGFSAAAAALYRSQPRVSVQVAELENALGVRLFDRSTHPARLTPQGRELLPHARAILAGLQTLCSTAAQSDATPRGEVRIGLYPSAGAHVLPRLLTTLAKHYPGIRIALHEGSSVDLERALTEDRIDLAVRPVLPAVRPGRLTHSLLWCEPLVAVVGADHPLAGRSSTSVRELADLPLVSAGDHADDPEAQAETALAFSRVGLTPQIVMRTNQPQTLTALARGGIGVGITNSMAMTVSNLDGVRVLPIRDAYCERQVAVWWRADRAESGAQRTIRDVLAAIPAPQGDPDHPDDPDHDGRRPAGTQTERIAV